LGKLPLRARVEKSWKAELYGLPLSAGETKTGGLSWPGRPLPELYAAAWQRIVTSVHGAGPAIWASPREAESAVSGLAQGRGAAFERGAFVRGHGGFVHPLYAAAAQHADQ
jgi:hypothetical protein